MKPLRKDAVRSKHGTVGYGYVGRWADGSLGWMMPEHVSGDTSHAEPISRLAAANALPEDKFTLCRITITPVLRRDGRHITLSAPRRDATEGR